MFKRSGNSNGYSEVKSITAKELEKIVKASFPGRTNLGTGLYLTITSKGSASFGFRYQLSGRRRLIGLGAYNSKTNSLAHANRAAAKCRAQISDGIDPISARSRQLESRGFRSKNPSASGQLLSKNFESVALEVIEFKKVAWKNSKHHQQWVNTLETYVFPAIGNTSVAEVTTEHVLQILGPIWTDKTETATRIRARIETILDFAIARQWREKANPARWKGHLASILPNPQKLKKPKHHPALVYSNLPDFFSALGEQDGFGARALELTIFTATRTNEVLNAEWSEFDLEKAIWVIPEARMKSGIEHRVPLSRQALKLVTELSQLPASNYLFANSSTGKPLSNGAMSSVLKRMKRTEITVHGFRSTFIDYVAEQTNTSTRVGETALAHKKKDAVEAAYQRGDFLEKRRDLMQIWADFCCGK
ncbi:tyrosine-type recombinase/integrase [Pseudomonadales bacterium]|nr:tyrosine-type recombinase/integrase [Pseudomonadales bacterium]